MVSFDVSNAKGPNKCFHPINNAAMLEKLARELQGTEFVQALAFIANELVNSICN